MQAIGMGKGFLIQIDLWQAISRNCGDDAALHFRFCTVLLVNLGSTKEWGDSGRTIFVRVGRSDRDVEMVVRDFNSGKSRIGGRQLR